MASSMFGCIYVFLIPPFQSPDESNHFRKAWHVSTGHLLPEKTPDARLGGHIPENINRVIDIFDPLRQDKNYRLNVQIARKAALLLPGNPVFTDFANTAIYAPTAYVPQAIGIFIVNNSGGTVLQCLYAARLLNLMLWIYLVACAIPLLQHLQTPVTFVATLPAVIVISSSLNADVTTNALCLWFFAASAGNNKIPITWTAAAILISSLNKLITLPLLSMWWINNRKSPYRTCLGISILVLTFVWALQSQKGFIPYDDYHPQFRDSQTLNEGVNPGKQLYHSFQHPLQTTQTLLKSLLKSLPATSAHLIGKFGWEKNYLPPPFLFLLILSLLTLLLSAPENSPKRIKLFYLAIASSFTLLLGFTTYLLWSPVGNLTPDNYQGRYFIPILPIICSITHFPLINISEKQRMLIATTGLFLGNCAMIWAIHNRYYT
jgi:uncharacterized membrane protein